MDFTAFFYALFLCALFQAAHCLHIPPDDIARLLLPTYDYIIVGGGVAGLVVANKLSRHPDAVTVLVLEAGGLDSSPDIITVPSLIGHGIIPSYNWNFSTAPQEFLDNNTRYYDQGHVVGGGSILNGLLMTRGAKVDYDAWETLGNSGWNWRQMLRYFKKSERFSPPLCSEQTEALHINPHPAYHGTKGHLEVGYPNFFYNQSINFLQGLSEVGVPILSDPNVGVSAGASIAPASLNAKNQSREDSRRAYLDHIMDRPNLHLASQQTVTRILMGAAVMAQNSYSNPLKSAYGVEFITSAGSPRPKVVCNKEVILSAGAIVSPALLQVSGIGPASMLEEMNVPLQVDLPGVGANFQDHSMVHAFYNYTAPGLFSTRNITGAVLEEVREQYFANRTGPWTHPLISTIAFPHLSHLTNQWPNLLSNASASPKSYLPPQVAQYPSIVKGYVAQLEQLEYLLSHTSVGAIEIMADSVGTLTVAVQHPLSRGFVRALSSDLFANGSVAQNIHMDPRYCSHPLDCDLILQGLQLNSRIIATEAMQQLQPRPDFPWSSTDENTLREAIRSQIVTEYHPAGTTSMMPLDMGGVVNSRLMVYGTTNLRVIDAGVIPLLPSAHIQAAVYAIAERAADIIIKDERLQQDEEPSPFTPRPTAGAGTSAPLGPGI
ncbi:putative GMC oxidoreductase, partial [Cladorrhinum sp. PSN259]